MTAFAILESAFLRSDFSYALVAQGSSTDTPTFYKVTALWATQDGSLLLWATLLSLFSTRGAVPHAPLAARDRAVGDGGARAWWRPSSCC